MVRHLFMVLLFHATLLICENLAAPNPQFYFPYHHSFVDPYFQQFSTSYLQKNATLVPSDDSRIVGGKPIKAGDLPFMAVYSVSDQNNKKHLCGGTLISSEFILTAAHCLHSPDPKNPYKSPVNEKVIVNSITFSNTPDTLPASAEVRKIVASKVHQLFRWVQSTVPVNRKIPNRYDVALMVLDKPVTRVKPVTLANCNQDYTDIEGKKKGLVAGWGLTNPDDANSGSTVLLGTELDITTNAVCQNLYDATKTQISSTQICAKSEGLSTCTGDDGGPLLIKSGNSYTQVGIISYGPTNCGKGSAPNVMTRVSALYDWINEYSYLETDAYTN